MLDDFLKEIGGLVSGVVDKSTDIPADKKDLVVEVSSDAIVKGLADNSKELTSLFLGNGSSQSVMNSIQKLVINSLIKKVGLDSDISRKLVDSILPIVIGAFTGKANSNGEGKFSLDTIMGALSEKSSEEDKSSVGSLLGAFGKLLG